MSFKYPVGCTDILYGTLSTFMQTLMNVRMMTPTTVMRGHSALTQREVTPAPVTLAWILMSALTQWGVTPALVTLVTLEMVSAAQVS